MPFQDKLPLIETIGLKKYFRVPNGYLHAVDDINIQIRQGETLGVVGESGCGKSTLGRVILRLLEATGGKVLLDGQEITNLPRQKKKLIYENMQMVFQDPYTSLNPRLSVGQLIEEPLLVRQKNMSRAQRQQRVIEAMEAVGLTRRYLNTYPHELDGGRRQRVGLTRALILDPRFVVCDEPVSTLDVSIQAQILNLLMDLQEQRNLTYMFISHDMCVVRHISTNIAVMYLGEIIEYASRDELFQQQAHPYTKALLRAIPTTDLASRKRDQAILKGEVANPINPEPGCRFMPRCPYATDRCKEKQHLKEIAPGHFVACCLYGN